MQAVRDQAGHPGRRGPSRRDIEAAETMLEEAKVLDRANKVPQAMAACAKVVRSYPETPAGKQAEARLKVMRKPKR